jgi:hypothetical protein
VKPLQRDVFTSLFLLSSTELSGTVYSSPYTNRIAALLIRSEEAARIYFFVPAIIPHRRSVNTTGSIDRFSMALRQACLPTGRLSVTLLRLTRVPGCYFVPTYSLRQAQTDIGFQKCGFTVPLINNNISIAVAGLYYVAFAGWMNVTEK